MKIEIKQQYVKITAAVILALGLLLGAKWYTSDGAKYDRAMAAIDSGDYAKAIDLLEPISYYMDSTIYIKQCAYDQGKVEMAKGNYETAIDYLSMIENPEWYDDTADLLYQCYTHIRYDYFDESSSEISQSDLEKYLTNGVLYQTSRIDGTQGFGTYYNYDEDFEDPKSIDFYSNVFAGDFYYIKSAKHIYDPENLAWEGNFIDHIQIQCMHYSDMSEFTIDIICEEVFIDGQSWPWYNNILWSSDDQIRWHSLDPEIWLEIFGWMYWA